MLLYQDNLGGVDPQPKGLDDNNIFKDFNHPDLSDEGSSDGVFDLVEDLSYKTKNVERLAQQTRQRHDDVRLDKMSRNHPECSQYEQLAIAIHDYIKLIMGIERKRRGKPTSTQSLPAPPSEQEFITWIERKVERRRLIENCAVAARSAYLCHHPLAKSSQLAKVEKHAVETHLSNLTRVPFASQVLHTSSRGLKYSTTVASTCEGALALSGYPRYTLDWYASIKSAWNEGMFAVILQEWEKCYKRGDADGYNIRPNQVTPKNIR